MKNLAVIIPSRLQPRPGGRTLPEFGPELWLDGARAGVLNQKGLDVENVGVYVGVDPNVEVPAYIGSDSGFHNDTVVVHGRLKGQAAAVNAAADAALADGYKYLAFLEDDDLWSPAKTLLSLPHLVDGGYELVTCSQRLVAENRQTPIGINHYPTPSGWLMRSDLWRRLGGLDESFKWLVDSEWIGRANEARVKRIHLTKRAVVGDPDFTWGNTAALNRLALHAEVVETSEPGYLVDRTCNHLGGMATIKHNGHEAAIADEESQRIQRRYGENPW